MFGHYKQKIINFIDSRIQKYLETHKQAEPVKEKEKSGFFAGDISMAQAENKNRQEKLKKLTENLKYSFQQGIEKFGFDKMKYEKNGKTYAMDEVLKPQDFVGLKGSPKDIIFTFFAKFGFIGYQICSILGQHWLISNACSLANQDALRNGWQNVFIENDDKNKGDNNDEDKEKKQKLLTDLYTVQQTKFNLNEVLLKWAYYRNLYGVSYLLPIIDGIDYEKPYNPDGIKKGSLKGFTVIEPYWMIPQFDKDVMTDPTNMKFLEPEYFLTNNGKKIHASHLIISKRKYVSDIMKASYYFGGISLAQEIYERVYAAEKSANEAPLILLTKRLNVYKIRDFRDIFTNPEAFIDRLKTLTEYRDNQGFLFCDKEDDIMQIDTALTDFDETVKQQYGLVSAVARVPEDKLFEKNPTGGLSSNGSYNEKNYTQDLNTLQTGVFQKAIDRINEITLRSEFESKDKVYIVFNPTDNPTEEEVTNLNKTKADTTAIYIANGVISPEEARMRLVEDKTAGYSFLKGVEMEEPSDEDKAEIENMIKEAQKKKNNNDNENGSAEDEIDEDVEWITVKGNHIPIKEGENKGEAIKKFFENKSEKNSESKKDIKQYVKEGFKAMPYFKDGLNAKNKGYKLYKEKVDAFKLNDGEIDLTEKEYIDVLKQQYKDLPEYKIKQEKQDGKTIYKLYKDDKVESYSEDYYKLKPLLEKGNKKRELLKKDLVKMGVKASELKESEENRDEKGRFASNNSQKSEKETDNIIRLRDALEEMLLTGKEEITVKNVRTDLEQYGGTNDITLKMGTNNPKTNKGKGIRHIVGKHGIEALKNAWYTIVYGKIERYIEKNKRIILKNNEDIAVLALDDNGVKKTWVVTAYNEEEYENKKP